jgi:hypothetical protein
MSVVSDVCDRILVCLQKLHPGDAQGLQPGLSNAEIVKQSRELLFPLPTEIHELYMWRNGNPWNDHFIFINYWMMSLENAVNAYCLRGSFADIRDLYFDCDDHKSKDDNYFWNRHWFPIFRSRDYHRFWVVVIGQESSPVMDIFPGEHCIELYPSFIAMLEAEAECFEKVIELLDEENCYPDVKCHPHDIGLFPDDPALMAIRYKHGYKHSHF